MIPRPNRVPRVQNVFDEQRVALVQALRDRGVTDEPTLAAIAVIPREHFISSAMRTRAYEDSALPIDNGQTISQPYTVAFMTQALALRGGEKVLEIGTGSGYQAAVLAHLGVNVYTVERHETLSKQAQLVLRSLGYTVTHRTGDGTIGWNQYAPFDGILITAGAPDVPETLARQLTIGGRLIVPVGTASEQTLYRVTRTAPEDWKAEDLGPFKFVPLIGREGWDDKRR